LTSSTGEVLGYEGDPLNANVGEVIVSSAFAQPGSSGSPMYDSEGGVVGVVYAAAPDGEHSLAIPVSTLKGLLDQTTLDEPVPDCQ
jgi:S1-C subfamily serine protease